MGNFNTIQEAAAGGGDLSFDGDTFGEDKTIGSSDNYALSIETNNTERLKFTNDGRAESQFTSQAWIAFDGTGTIAVNDSHNVSSISDEGTGSYIVNWDVDFGNDDYCCTGMCNDIGYGGALSVWGTPISTYKTVAQLKIATHQLGQTVSVQTDAAIAMVVCFGDV